MPQVEILDESLPGYINTPLYFAERTLFLSDFRNTHYAETVGKELTSGKSALIISNHNTRFNTLRGIFATLVSVDPPHGLIIPMGDHICYESNPHWWTHGFDWYYRKNRIQSVPIYLNPKNGQNTENIEKVITALKKPETALFHYPEGQYSRILREAKTGLSELARRADVILPVTTHMVQRFGVGVPAVTFMPILPGKELFKPYKTRYGIKNTLQMMSDMYMTFVSLPLPEKERGYYRDFASAALPILDGYKPESWYPEYRIKRVADVLYELIQEECFPAREVLESV